jgi:nucleoside-diphosphate-sugar epimerase
MDIGITGASGFIGQALARRLRNDGHHVVGLDRSEEGAALCSDFQPGDVTRADDLARFVRGRERIYHTAAIVAERGDPAAFRAVNVEAPIALAHAAKAAGVRELVHFSSVMVYGFDYVEGVREAGPLDGGGNLYCQSKIAAERGLLPLHQAGRFEVFVIRPGDVYGPGSQPWVVRPLEMMARHQWLWIDSRRSLFNHVYIDNLLDGIDVVVQQRASGRAFNLTDDRRTTVREFFTYHQRFLGQRWIPELPGRIAEPVAGAIERVATRLGLEPPINREAVRYMRRHATYSCAAAKGLGYKPRVDLATGMQRTFDWCRAAGVPLV